MCAFLFVTPPSGKPCCSRWSRCSDRPNVSVAVLPDRLIRMKNELRESNRDIRMAASSIERFLNPWESLWPSERGSDIGLAQWPCESRTRQNLQLRLMDALTVGRPAPFADVIMRGDFRTISCWLSLNGIRLNDIYRRVGLNDGAFPTSL